MLFNGKFYVRCKTPRGFELWREQVKNTATIEGLTYILSAGLAGGAQLTSWFVGLIDNGTFSQTSISDVMASHPGWQELTNYSQGARVAWSPLVASGGLVSNTANMEFTFTSAADMAGLFVASNSTKGGTSGTLWASALFPLPKTVAKSQTLELIYVVQGAGGT